MKYRIKKLKLIPNGMEQPKIELHFEKLNEIGGLLADIVLKTDRLSSKKLRDTLYELNGGLIEISEISFNNDQLIGITEIRFKHDDKKGLGVEFIAELLLKNSRDNLIFKTPVKYEEAKDKKELMSENMMPLIDEVLIECESFIEAEKNLLQLELKFQIDNVK